MGSCLIVCEIQVISKKVKNRILKRIAEGGSTLNEISMEFGVSTAAMYKWRKKGVAAKVAPLKKYRPRHHKIAILIDATLKLCAGMDVPVHSFLDQLAKEVDW